MKTVILTEKQLFCLKEAINSKFLIREFTISLSNKLITEANVKPRPNKTMAIYLARGFRYNNLGEKINCKKLTFTGNNPFDTDNIGVGESYYFHMKFIVDGKVKNGLIRISDHSTSTSTFEKHGVDYGLSIVFNNDNGDFGRTDSRKAVVFEYIANDIKYNTEVRSLADKILNIDNVVINNNKVVEPHGLDFKLAKKENTRQQPKEYILITKNYSTQTKDKLVLFQIYGHENLTVTAIQTPNGYRISKEDEALFNIGDKLKFYMFTSRSKAPVEKGLQVIE